MAAKLESGERGAAARGRVLWCVLVLVGGIGAWGYWHNDSELGQGAQGLDRLSSKVNPNTASWSSLARLPRIGEVRANAIVAYRERVGGQVGGEEQVYRCAEDLGKVGGIGAITVQGIREYLTFGD